MTAQPLCFQTLLRGLATAAILVATTSLASSQQGVELIQNRWTPSQYLHVQTAQPVAGPVSTTSPAARWAIEQTADPNIIRLRNVGSGLYLYAETDQLRVGALVQSDMPSAGWTLERVSGIPDARIRNNATGAYLHTKDGPLVLGEASPQWQQSYWKFIPVGSAVAETVVPGPPPASGCRASNGRWLLIKGQYICAHGCTPGFHVVGNTCVPNCAAGFHSAGGACVKNCKAGYHPVGGLCVKTCPPGFHPMGNICVKNQPICGPNAHLSLGHCCPNGKNWNGALKKCV